MQQISRMDSIKISILLDTTDTRLSDVDVRLHCITTGEISFE